MATSHQNWKTIVEEVEEKNSVPVNHGDIDQLAFSTKVSEKVTTAVEVRCDVKGHRRSRKNVTTIAGIVKTNIQS